MGAIYFKLMSVAIRQRRNDLFREQAKEEDFITLKEKENDEFTAPLGMFIIGFIIFTLFVGIINYDI